MKFKLSYFFFWFFIILPVSVTFAQKQVNHQKLIWFAYTLTVPIDSLWYVQTELQERFFFSPELAQAQFLTRSHLHRKLGDSGWELSSGFAFFLQKTSNALEDQGFATPELRPHIEGYYKQKLKSLVLDHRYRAEARFFNEGRNAVAAELDKYVFQSYRFRYRFQISFPIVRLQNQKAIHGVVSDEVFLQAGKKLVQNVFDQNRTYLGFSYQVSARVNLEAGYLTWFQQTADQNFISDHIISFSVSHSLKQSSR